MGKFYLVLQGKVGMYMRLNLLSEEKSDKLEIAKEMSANETFGEISLIHNTSSMATYACTENCILGVLSRDQFNYILK